MTKVYLYISPEQVTAIKEAIAYAYSHPLSYDEILNSNYGESHTTTQPNAVDLLSLALCFTVEQDGESKNIWFRHLALTIPPESEMIGKIINHSDAVEIAREFFGFQFNGPHDISVSYARGFGQNLLIMHVYEPISDMSELKI